MMRLNSLDDLRPNKDKKYPYLLNNDKKTFKPFKSFFSENRIKQADLYCLLKSTFGPPNGFMTFLRGNHSSNFIQWDYSFKVNGCFLDILASERFLEFRLISDNEESINISEEQIFEFFETQINNNKESIRKVKGELEHWDIFINTHSRLKESIKKIYDRYSNVQLKQPITIKRPVVSRHEQSIYMSQFKKYTKDILEKKTDGLALRMLIPVVGESLVNLLFYLLARDEIRADKHLLDNFFRNQVDIRIKTMHLNCKGLIKPYDQNDDRFKNFLRIMNTRNDFLHGNVMPVSNCFDDVYFDGTIPIFNEEKDMSVEYMEQNMFQVDDETINANYQYIFDFEEYMVENVTDQYKGQIKLVIESTELGFNKKTNRIGVLFDNTLSQTMMIIK